MTSFQEKKMMDSGAYQALENLRMRMLDLSARNRLINFRHTKNASLRVIDELPDQLVETLLSEKVMRFQAIPEPTEEELIESGYLRFDEEQQQLVRLKKDPSGEEWARVKGFETSYEVPESSISDDLKKHSDDAIQTLLYPYELEARLKRILQTSNSAIQEMGANILYLAFGFLEWFEDTDGANKRIAPLFLVPVRLSKGRLHPETRTYEYSLKYSGEDILPNLSLREKLRADFALALPDLDENTVPEDYFKQVRNLIQENQPKWRLRRFISLALLNFSKLLMYLDLDPAHWPGNANIVNHPVVSRFLSGYGSDSGSEDSACESFGFGEEHPIDEIAGVHDRYPLIDDADSSQHSALIDAVDGRNLVIEGPPGTGKSQTITNLIAAVMAQGKTVLFVAEKLAALEVVKCRLDSAGLGEFCLELHSHKSQKRKVLDEVEERLRKHGRYRNPEKIKIEISRYEELKDRLKKHAELINQKWENTGRTFHEIFMAATRYRHTTDVNPERLHPEGYDGQNFDPVIQRRNEDEIAAYCGVYQAVESQIGAEADLQSHPWYGVRNCDLQMFDQDRVVASLAAWQESLVALGRFCDRIAQPLGCDAEDVAERVSELEDFLGQVQKIPSLRGDEKLDVLPDLRGEALAQSHRYLELFNQIREDSVWLSEVTNVEDLSELLAVESLLSASERLERLVGRNVEMGELSVALNRLSAVWMQIEDIAGPLGELTSALGKKVDSFFLPSECGLEAFRTFFRLSDRLPHAYWKKRNALFDNEELDSLLPALRPAIESLREQRDALQDVFQLDCLPDEHRIRQLAETLDTGGIFRWFKGKWRKARKELRALSVSPDVAFGDMQASLAPLSAFLAKREALLSVDTYEKSLGAFWAGMDTDLDTVETLRSWYREVRRQYGVGFGKQVELGHVLLEMELDVARGVHSLSERGVVQQLTDLIEDLASLKEVFAPVPEFRESTTLLVGEKGILPRVHARVKEAIGMCGPLVNDDDLSMDGLADRIDRIVSLKDNLDRWNAIDLDRKLFHGNLELDPAKSDNERGLSVLKHTLELASIIDHAVHSRPLLDYMERSLENETFEWISAMSGELANLFSTYRDAFAGYASLVDLDFNAWSNASSDRIASLVSRNASPLEDGTSFQNWLDYIRQRARLDGFGLGRLAGLVETSEVEVGNALNAYRSGIYDLLARDILKKQPELGRFSGATQSAIQSQFADYDNRLKKLQCEQIAWKIDQVRIPTGNIAARASERTERALLEHECSKKKRHLPIRQLLHRAGTALVSLKPCFMMGPMSVAHYLEPGNIRFDLVVMDEASQIKPQDALGAVARGGQLVVVGDPKQLPPTSFFDRLMDDDEKDPTGIEESESILDATRPIFDARRLRWHYRSQHESLIAFSNHSFYENDLVLFPSPNKQTDSFGIQFTRVARGCFVNRKNLEEARIISEAVREHFLKNSDESLGIVAMSAEQRQHIERAIETLAKEDSLFRSGLERDATRKDALFIKNLENVQGDERDVVFISMTYGPQEPEGRVFQRFGPINSDVGWRRLNVLFTRSKKRMHIFSSMGSDDIVIQPTSRRGVKALREFLSFCETGILHSTDPNTGRQPDSDFEIEVMSALENEGFECIPQVGVAGFFIDVAVVDPGNPGRFLMGIECDGATYHSAKSARDRDRLRQAVLERLGWKIRRIWSTDWFKDPAGQLAPIIRELKLLRTAPAAHFAPQGSKAELLGEAAPMEIDRNLVRDERATSGPESLMERLLRFDREVIRKACPNTPRKKQLLRPAMLEALVEFMPTSKSEFLETIPLYIRQGTEAEEGQFLERVFELINSSIID